MKKRGGLRLALRCLWRIRQSVCHIFAIAVFRLFVAFRLVDTFHGNHLLILGGGEDRHALGGAACDTDAVYRHTDQLAAIGNQHDLVAFIHRESRNEFADFRRLRGIGGADALAATTRCAEVVRRRTLAVAFFRDGQHEFFACLQFLITLFAEFAFFRDFLTNQCDIFLIDPGGTPLGGRTLEVGRTLPTVQLPHGPQWSWR